MEKFWLKMDPCNVGHPYVRERKNHIVHHEHLNLCKNCTLVSKGEKSSRPILQDKDLPHKPDKEATFGEYLSYQRNIKRVNRVLKSTKSGQ